MQRAVGTLVAVAALLVAPAARATPASSQRPVIERVEPTSGPPGSVVRVVGRRLGDCQVRIGAQPVQVEQSLPSRLLLRLPDGIRSGPLHVTCAGKGARGPDFRVTQRSPPPVITGVTPAAAGPGAVIEVRGRHFSTRLTHNEVAIGGVPAVVRSATPAVLHVVVPEGTDGGPVRVQVRGTGAATGKVPLRVRRRLRIDRVEPRRAGASAEVELFGDGFSEVASENRVTIGGRAVAVLSASRDRLRVQLPARPRSGAVVVTRRGVGRTRAFQDFVVQAMPRLRGAKPARVRPGARLTLLGGPFGSAPKGTKGTKGTQDPVGIQVVMADRPARVLSVTDDQLVVAVPEDLPAGSVLVSATVHGVGPVAYDGTVDVLPALRIDRFSPRAAAAGATLTLSGTGFSDRAEVTIAGQPAPIISTVPGQLRVRVPRGKSGRIRVTCAGASVETSQPFIISHPPRITGVSPGRVVIGDELTIEGAGFGDNPSVLDVRLGNARAKVLALTQDKLVVRVSAKAGARPLRVTLPMHGSAESDRPIDVLSKLRVRGVRPLSPRASGALAIRGSGFVPGQTTVELAGKSLTVESATATRLRVRVPEDAVSGRLTVRLSDGRSAHAREPVRLAR